MRTKHDVISSDYEWLSFASVWKRVQCVGSGLVKLGLKPGDAVTIKDSPKPRALAARQMEATQIRTVPDWLVVDRDNFSGTVSRIPTREEIAPVVNEQLVVELYSR